MLEEKKQFKREELEKISGKIIYLDYSATTPVGEAAINKINEIVKYPGNPNSVHSLGKRACFCIEESRNNILKLLGLNEDYELIPTSGATEANNLALKGAFDRYYAKGKNHIITTELEHSSINAPLSALQNLGAEVDFVDLNKDGSVNIEHLESLIKENTLMVSIGAINSETGIQQPIEKIGKLLKEKYPNVLFHSDATQALGKIKMDYRNVDMLSFSGHKFYCFKGIGGLIKRKNVVLIPQIKGGGSTTKYRSGTPCVELIAAMNAALLDTYYDFENKYNKIKEFNNYLRNELNKIEGIVIHSPNDAIPHILNFSCLGHKSDDLQQYMSDREIYISTRTACAANANRSATIYRLTRSEELATTSVRISISYKTTMEEINIFLNALKEYVEG